MPLHPAIVHLPIALALLLPLVTGTALVAWWRGRLPHRTWLLVAALQALLVVSAIAAMRSGEHDEERVERVVPENVIEAHEEAAETFLGGAAVVLGLAVATAAIRRERSERGSQALAAATLVGTLVVLVLGYRVGEAGGGLVYQHGAASAWTPSPGAPAPASRLDDDHDDD